MKKKPRPQSQAGTLSLITAQLVLGVAACAGPDHLTDPVVSEGGAFFASLGGTSAITGSGGANNPPGSGGHSQGGTSPASGGNTATAPAFDWGAVSYDANGGTNITYQDHYNGTACFMSCHSHSFTFGGTLYQADGTTAAANVQIGILSNGTLTTTYSGTKGNFFASIGATVDWTAVQIAVRSAAGARAMPINASASGNCNNCHGASNRILAP
jgi:hypothetical protein